jgi:hypothetical protein
MMFFVISSPKHGGNGHSKSYDSRKELIKPVWKSLIARLFKITLLLSCLSLSSVMVMIPAEAGKSAYTLSKAAAERCSVKLNNLADIAVKRKSGQKQTTQFSQDEINSYLALNLSARYHPCLKSLMLNLEENNGLQAVASIDFDSLKSSSNKLLSKLMGLMFSGTHTLTAKGQLISNGGKANFRLAQARFDDTTLPQYLVEQIITAVGRKQNPPFDPLQPSKIFYEIVKMDIHSEHIIVYQ